MIMFRQAAAAMLIVAASGGSAARAQGLPTDADFAEAIRVTANHLGLVEYCHAKGYVSQADVGNMAKALKAVVGGLPTPDSTGAAQAAGRRGTITGDQIIGLLDASNPKRPEHVLAGQTVTLPTTPGRRARRSARCAGRWRRRSRR